MNRIVEFLLPVRLSNVVAGGGRQSLVVLLDGRQPELGQGDGGIRKFVLQNDMAVRIVFALHATFDPAIDGFVGGGIGDSARSRSDQITVDVPIIGVPIPKNGPHTHLPCDGTDTIVNITIWWAPALGSDAEDLLGHSQGVVEFSDNFGVGEGGHRRVRPGVGTNGVSVVETTLSSCWSAHNLRSDVEQVGLLVIVLEQIVVQVGFGPFGIFLGDGPVVHGAIVIRQTPGTSSRANGNVWGDVVDLRSCA